MAPPLQPVNDAAKYILTVMKYSAASKPDYHAVATEFGLTNANVAQKRFKKYVEDAGFSLVNGAIVDPNAESNTATTGTSTPTTPKTPRAKKSTTTTPASKKRKLIQTDDADEDSSEAKTVKSTATKHETRDSGEDNED